MKRDGFPGYRRVSAIFCIEEKVVDKYPFPDPFALLDKARRGDIWPAWEKARERHWSGDNERWVEHDVLLLHNPYAYHQLSHGPWSDFPQLVPVADEMKWTDGYRMDV